MKKINSAGLLFGHLIGEIGENNKIYIHQVNTYKHAFDFYNASRELHNMDSADIELLCILGIPQKVNAITKFIDKKLKDNYDSIINNEELSLNIAELDNLGNIFNKLIQEYTFLDNDLKYVRKHNVDNDEWIMSSYWFGNGPDDNTFSLIENTVDIWLDFEKPIIMGKQLTIQSFHFSDLFGRKIIGTFPDYTTKEWSVILEGGLKLNLNSDMPYVREKIGIKEFDGFTIGDIDSFICNPIYAYGKWYYPTEIYEEWHKVFLYVAALNECEWNLESLIDVFENFLDFIGNNICDIWDAEPLITKDEYHQILYMNVENLKNYLKGNEEPVISKDLWLLLNSRYVYLPYIYDILKLSTFKNKIVFNKKDFENKLLSLDVEDTYQKGLNFEDVAEYFINSIDGLKISGKRVKTEVQEIDLSAVNISLDHNLWQMGAYILIECKNWKEKVDIQVIRGLSHTAELKGNKTTILFSKNGITKDAENEIIRTALNGKFILNITKEELKNINSNKDCYELLISKWKELQYKIQDKLNI